MDFFPKEILSCISIAKQSKTTTDSNSADHRAPLCKGDSPKWVVLLLISSMVTHHSRIWSGAIPWTSILEPAKWGAFLALAKGHRAKMIQTIWNVSSYTGRGKGGTSLTVAPLSFLICYPKEGSEHPTAEYQNEWSSPMLPSHWK